MSTCISPEQLELFVDSHGVAVETIEPMCCDACGQSVALDDDGAYQVPGNGVFLWKRGDEVRLERVPLCGSCASAIGMSAFARWEIEEEEG